MKNTKAASAVLFSALAAAIPLQQRAYHVNTLTVVDLTTVTTIVSLSGPLPSGAKGYSPDEVAQLTKQAVQLLAASIVPAAAPTTQAKSSVNGNTIPPMPTIAPSEANYAANPIPNPSSSSSLSIVAPVVPVIPETSTITTATLAVTSASSSPSATPGAGGYGQANPFFPNGPRVGDTVNNGK
jgi:hypothetical protein